MESGSTKKKLFGFKIVILGANQHKFLVHQFNQTLLWSSISSQFSLKLKKLYTK